MDDATDRELWVRAAEQHDGPAFGELFERHADRVFRHCFRRTGSWSAAEDLTSVVFLEAWRRRREVRFSESSVLPWLLAVANNATRNAERTRRRHQRLIARIPDERDEPDIAEDAADRVDNERVARDLLLVLRGLGESEREVLALCDWAGLTYAEAADALGVPVGTIRSRLSRARRHLRDRLEPEAGPEDSARDPEPAAQDRPGQDRPGQDRLGQDRLGQDRPARAERRRWPIGLDRVTPATPEYGLR